MRFVWVGYHQQGLPALNALLEAGLPMPVITLRRDRGARGACGTEYETICARHGAPLDYVTNLNDPAAHRLLQRLAPDLVFVIGWPQVVRPETLAMARIGMIGSHASLLPHNHGSAPINWSLIRGESEAGASLIWLTDDPRRCDLIDQQRIDITPYDTAGTLYSAVAAANRTMLLRLVPRLLAGDAPHRPRLLTGEGSLPRRRAADSRIDWQRSAWSVYNFIRALTRPFGGAFGVLEGQRWTVWNAALAPVPAPRSAEAGQVIGPVVSPVPEACGQLVACGRDVLILLEVERDGTVFKGPTLSDQPWARRRWTSR